MTQKTLFGGHDVFPRSSVTTKLPTYKAPSGAPMSEAEQEAYRRLAVAVVSIGWHLLKRAVELKEIYSGFELKTPTEKRWIDGVQKRVQDMIDAEDWAFAKFVRCRRTVDRRVNEAASPDFYEDHVARIVCVRPGLYQPNPVLLK